MNKVNNKVVYDQEANLKRNVRGSYLSRKEEPTDMKKKIIKEKSIKQLVKTNIQ